MLAAAHGPRQREAGEPTGAEDTYRTVQLSGSTSDHRGVAERFGLPGGGSGGPRRGRISAGSGTGGARGRIYRAASRTRRRKSVSSRHATAAVGSASSFFTTIARRPWPLCPQSSNDNQIRCQSRGAVQLLSPAAPRHPLERGEWRSAAGGRRQASTPEAEGEPNRGIGKSKTGFRRLRRPFQPGWSLLKAGRAGLSVTESVRTPARSEAGNTSERWSSSSSTV